jgi:large subunit ribosomal protein L17
MFRNMLASFFEWEKIETTACKAKELRPLAEKLITLGKRGDLHARRRVFRFIPNKTIIKKLFSEIAPKFEKRMGGYTRIIKTGFRPGDSAPMAVIELVKEAAPAKKKKTASGKKPRAKTAASPKKEPIAKKAKEKPEATPSAAATQPETLEAPAEKASDATPRSSEGTPGAES